MAIPERLAFGGTGWHGDQSVSLRSSLGAIKTLVNELATQHSDLLAKLDADGGVPEVDYASTCGLTASAVSGVISEHIAQGGSYAHGDDAVKLRLIMQDAQALANDLRAQHLALIAKLDADALGFSDYSMQPNTIIAAATLPAADIHAEFANGRIATHGDQGVAVRLALQAIATNLNALKGSHNQTLTSLDQDVVVADVDYASTLTVSTGDVN